MPKLVQTIIDASEDSIYQKSKIVNISGKRSYSLSKTEDYQETDIQHTDELSASQVDSLWKNMRELKKKVDAIEIATRITQQDLVLVTDLLRGDRTVADIKALLKRYC